MRLRWLVLVGLLHLTPAWAETDQVCLGNRLEKRPDTTSHPGWIVCVYPRPIRGQTPLPVGRFVASPGGFKFGDFRKTMPHPGWASFHGGSIFYATDPGTYTFSVILKSTERYGLPHGTSCNVGLRAADTDLLSPEQANFHVVNYGIYERSFTGGLQLASGGHPIEFNISCPVNGDAVSSDQDSTLQEDSGAKDVFDKTSVSFAVFGPNDMGARTPRDNEIIHFTGSGAKAGPAKKP